MEMLKAFIHVKVTEQHNDEVEDQDEQIMGILKYLIEWFVNHILYVDGQIQKVDIVRKAVIF